MGEKLIISGDDKTCTFCGRPYEHRRACWIDEDDIQKGMKHHIRLTTAHATCREFGEKKKKLQQELLDLEWKIFQYINR